MITFSNGSTIEPIYPPNKTNNGKGERAKYTTYFCKLCNTTHYIKITDSYFIKGDWYCKKSVDKITMDKL